MQIITDIGTTRALLKEVAKEAFKAGVAVGEGRSPKNMAKLYAKIDMSLEAFKERSEKYYFQKR